jgi:hypothetical protein
MDTPNVPATPRKPSSRIQSELAPRHRPKVRGRKYRDLAAVFLEQFPIGTQLTTAQFDVWAHQHGLYKLPLPPTPDPAASPAEREQQEEAYAEARLAMQQRRHIWRTRLNSAAAHPFRQQEPGGPYIVERVAGETLEVRVPYKAIAENHVALRVVSFTETIRQYLEWLMLSQDWSQLPPHEQIFAEGLHDDIGIFHGAIKAHAEGLENKFKTFRARIDQGIAAGRLQPVNGAMKAIAAGTPLTPPAPQREDAMADGETEEEFC